MLTLTLLVISQKHVLEWLLGKLHSGSYHLLLIGEQATVQLFAMIALKSFLVPTRHAIAVKYWRKRFTHDRFG